MSNIKKPASSTATIKKLLLAPGDPLIKTLKPDYYVIVDPDKLTRISDPAGEDPADEQDDPDDPPVEELKSPSLSDITLVSKTLVTDKNKNQYVEFVFNIKNSGGETVVGAEVYGQ
jgi:hypothetical protein